MSALVDTHCHLDQLPDVPGVLAATRDVGVVAVVAVGTDRASNEATLELAANWQGFVLPAVGLHPCHLVGYDAPRIAVELQFIQDSIGVACALGEVGLDYHKRTLADVPRDRQQGVFRDVLALAVAAQLPVLVHSRYAWTDALRLVNESGARKAVFHWFTGFAAVLRGIMDRGYYVSATPAAEYHEEHRRAVRAVPLEQLLLETDAPVWYGRASRYESRPADVVRSLRAVVELKAESKEKVAAMTTRAAGRVFGGIIREAKEEGL